MKTIEMEDVQHEFSALCQEVASTGQAVVITRGREPLVSIVPMLRTSGGRIESVWLTAAQRQWIATARNINNSDLDFCEFQGRLIINYSWGNQQGVEHLAEAIYEGMEQQFLRGWFPQH